MTQREKVLVGLVGGTVAVLLNVFLLSFFSKNRRVLQADLEQKQQQLAAMQTLLENRTLWEQRAVKLSAVQPKIENESKAGELFLDHVREVAQRNGVMFKPGTLSVATPERRPHTLAQPISIEIAAPWDAMVKFLQDLQGPEKFIVLEKATFRVDATDPTQMNGQFRIAKWFAPKS